MTEKAKAGVASLERALRIIGCYSAHDKGLSLSEIAARTGFYKSTILRLCASLQKFGYLNRLDDGRFVLGSTIFRLGQIYQRSFDLTDFVIPVLQRLASQTNLSASLWIKEGEYRVCLYRTESDTPGRHTSAQVGERWPLDRGGSASTVLRAFSDVEALRYEKVRQARLAISMGEFVPELAAISAPVLSADRNLVGALSLGGFRSRFTKPAVARYKPLVLAAARDITLSLGAGAAPAPPPRTSHKGESSRRGLGQTTSGRQNGRLRN